jgi:hypothetical protein
MADVVVYVDGIEVFSGGRLLGNRMVLSVDNIGLSSCSSHRWEDKFDAFSNVVIHSSESLAEGADNVYVREEVNIANAMSTYTRVHTIWFL